MFVKSYIKKSNIGILINRKYQKWIDKCCCDHEEDTNKDITREDLETVLWMAKKTPLLERMIFYVHY